jgi:hypothetical protein
VFSVLDVDVSPSVAVEEAGLGSYGVLPIFIPMPYHVTRPILLTTDELLEAVRLADVVKPAKHAADQLLAMFQAPP